MSTNFHYYNDLQGGYRATPYKDLPIVSERIRMKYPEGTLAVNPFMPGWKYHIAYFKLEGELFVPYGLDHQKLSADQVSPDLAQALGWVILPPCSQESTCASSPPETSSNPPSLPTSKKSKPPLPSTGKSCVRSERKGKPRSSR